MKTTNKIIFLSIVYLCFNMNAYAQMHGIYTVGNGGSFSTIQSAINAAVTDGVDGPVFFHLITGIYNERVTINPVPGVSHINTITIESQTGNPPDVTVNGFNLEVFIVRSDFLIFRNLTIGGTNAAFRIVNNIKILNNFFLPGSGGIFSIDQRADNIEIIGNSNLQAIRIDQDQNNKRSNLKIINNSIRDLIMVLSLDSCLIENNSASSIIIQRCTNVNILKNNVSGDINLGDLDNSKFINNFGTSNVYFIQASFFRLSNCLILSNTLVYTFAQGIRVNGTNNVILNNIFINPSGGLVLDFTSSTNSSSDYNDIFNGGNAPLIKKNNLLYDDLNTFTSATGLDSHSISHQVTFVSATDLHLAGSSIGDIQLIGIPTPFVTDDIDENPRNPLYPYKGADEADMPLPVDLASFTTSVTGSIVKLKWTTNSELNNSGFAIERKSVAVNDWTNIGFVKGHGTTNSPTDYEFTDRNLSSGSYNYRLTQMDLNGNFKYLYLFYEVVIGLPTGFFLSQNYPNPFNPVTKLEFRIPKSGFVTLKVFNAIGQQIETLVKEIKSAGVYEVEFDGSNFSSGIYFYSMNVDGNNIYTKRMILMK